MKNSIKSKLLRSYLTILTITIFLMISIQFGFLYLKKTEVTIESATKLSQIMGTNLAASLSFNDELSAENILRSLHVDSTIEAALIYDKNEKLFSSYITGKTKEQSVEMLKLLDNNPVYNDIDNIIVSSTISHDNESLGKLFLVYNTNEIKSTLEIMLQISLAVSIFIFIIMLKISSMLQKHLTKPIYVLVNTMKEILEHNNFTKTINEKSDDEFQTLFDGFNTMLNKIQKDKSELESLANTDPLTELYNRRHFFELVKKFLDMSKRENKVSTLLMIDIDKFKNINDTYGHDIGDLILQGLAKVVLKNIRKGDVFARFGGEEFIIFLPHSDYNNSLVVAEKVRKSLEAYRDVENIKFTVSIGLFEFLDDINDAIKKVDIALYKAKENGRNRVVIFTD